MRGDEVLEQFAKSLGDIAFDFELKNYGSILTFKMRFSDGFVQGYEKNVAEINSEFKMQEFAKFLRSRFAEEDGFSS